MNKRILYSLFLAFLPINGEAAIIATYRGDMPNTIFPAGIPSNSDFDINGDGTPDYSFYGGVFFSDIKSYDANQIVSTTDSVGGHVVPVQAGDLIGDDAPLLGGGWHPHANEFPPGSNLSYGYGLGDLQFITAYIGVSFELEDGTHYGWIQYSGFGVEREDYPIAEDTPGGWIDSWAWESEPGVPIIAGAVPEPSVVWLAGIGLLFPLWRRGRELA